MTQTAHKISPHRATGVASRMRRFTVRGGPLPGSLLDRAMLTLAGMPRPSATLIWAVLMGLGLLLVAHARYTADLSAFLPSSPTASQRLLVDQLREGLASRLITAEISGGDGQTRAALSRGMAARVAGDARLAALSNGDAAGSLADQRFLLTHRYLLSQAVTPARFSVEGLKAALVDTLDLLASPAGLLAKDLLANDPTGEMLQIIDQMASGAAPHHVAGVWSSRDGEHALLIAQTRAQGSDTDGQEAAVAALRAAFEKSRAQLPAQAAGQVSLKLTGPPVFAVESRERIKGEVLRLSGVSTLLVVLLLLAVYRSPKALALGLVPVVSGAVAGVACVSLGFGVVHGITLGFGVTLIGEAVDYSIYLFIQARGRALPAADWQRSVWPTIRLGMLTSVVGFASLVPSGFPGLAQLGVYSIAGLLAGAAVTRFVLPRFLTGQGLPRDLTLLGRRLARLLPRLALLRPALLVMALLSAGVLIGHRSTLLSHELQALSPVPKADLDLDERLHADLGAPDSGYLVALTAPSSEAVLVAAEAAGGRLRALSDAGVVGGFTSPAHYLPSEAAQAQRRAALPPPAVLRERLREALVGLPLAQGTLEPFLADVEHARHAPLLTAQDLARTSLGAAAQALLFESGGSWHALLPLKPPARRDGAVAGTAACADCIDVAHVRQGLSGVPGSPVVLGIKAEADRLYDTYVREAVGYSLLGFVGIVLLLSLALRDRGRVLRVVAPVVLAVLAVAAGLALAGQPLMILHIIGMLLIVAIGSNYALFFDRRTHARGEGSVPLTLASLLVANLATVLTFGVLAFSSVPVLSALGQTVAPGTLLALLFSAVLADAPAGRGDASGA